MKQTISIILALFMIIMAVPVAAFPANANIGELAAKDKAMEVDLRMITGDSTYSVTRTCKICHMYGVEVYCVGGSSMAPDVACPVYGHQSCTITQRVVGSANAFCTKCGSYGYDWGDYPSSDGFVGHIDTCVHTYDGVKYYTCVYGPRG